MSTAREYFDQSPYHTYGTELKLETATEAFFVPFKIAYDFESGSKHLIFFIPTSPWAHELFRGALQSWDKIWSLENEVEVESGLAGHAEKISSKDLPFTGRIVVWAEDAIDIGQWDMIGKELGDQGKSLLVRDKTYVDRRASFVKPAAFISHDSRDKPQFVRPLADELRSKLCPVWYDEYSLVPGSSLRESIEAGLKTCEKCVIVLSPNFFANGGWSKREFDSVYTREIVEQKRVMVPVWLGVTRDEVYNYSPILADSVGINADLGVEEVARRVMRSLNFTAPH